MKSILYLPVIIVSDCQWLYWLQNCLLIPFTPHGDPTQGLLCPGYLAWFLCLAFIWKSADIVQGVLPQTQDATDSLPTYILSLQKH